MKTFENKQQVTHIEHGQGIVERLKNNDTMGWIVFKNSGQGQWFRADDKSIQRGVNTYVEKPTAHGVLAEVQKLQIVYQQRVDAINAKSKISDVMLAHRSSLNESIQHLENILQGVGNEL